MILLGDIEHGRLIARASQTGFDAEVDGVVSRINQQGDLLGGFILTRYNGAIVEAHMAGMRSDWCTPELLWLVFDYAFIHLKVRKVMCTVGSANQKSLDQVQRAGFKQQFVVKDGTMKGDLILLSMSRDECKWLKLRKRYMRVNGHAEMAYAAV